MKTEVLNNLPLRSMKHFITSRQQSCGKVMSSQASVTPNMRRGESIRGGGCVQKRWVYLGDGYVQRGYVHTFFEIKKITVRKLIYPIVMITPEANILYINLIV